MSNRFKIQKLQKLNGVQDRKWQLKWLDTFLLGIPSALLSLAPIGSFIRMLTVRWAILPRTADWVKRYDNINDDSLTNNVNNND